MAMALTKDDWIRAALRAVGEGGVGAVAVEPLAASLGATKGSFYWHFANREALLEEMLAAWEREATDEFIAAVEGIVDPVDRLRQLLTMAMEPQSDDEPVDLALLASDRHPVLAPVMARVQAKRLAFLERCFRDMGLRPAECRHRARLGYSAYLGWFEFERVQGNDTGSAKERAAYRRTVIKLLSIGVRPGCGGR